MLLMLAQGILALIFIGSGSAKIRRAPRIVAELTALGIFGGQQVLIGLVELGAALCLLAGFWLPLLAGLGAGILSGTMLGALGVHAIRDSRGFLPGTIAPRALCGLAVLVGLAH